MSRSQEIKKLEEQMKELKRREKEFLDEADSRKEELIKRWEKDIMTMIDSKKEEILKRWGIDPAAK